MPNKAIYKDSIKIHYYFPFIVFVIFLFIDALYNEIYHYGSWGGTPQEIPSVIGHSTILISMVTGGMALIQAGGLKRKKISEFFASIPVKKRDVLSAHYFAGCTILLSGYFVHAGIIAGINMFRLREAGLYLYGFYLMPLINGCLLMILTYTFFFLIGTLHKNAGGIILSMTVLLFFVGTGVSLSSYAGYNQGYFDNIFGLFLDLTRPERYLNMDAFHGNEMLFFIDSYLIIIVITVCFALILRIADSEDIAGRKGIFCVDVPTWVKGIIGAVTAYAIAGAFFLWIVLSTQFLGLINITEELAGAFFNNWFVTICALGGGWFTVYQDGKRKELGK